MDVLNSFKLRIELRLQTYLGLEYSKSRLTRHYRNMAQFLLPLDYIELTFHDFHLAVFAIWIKWQITCTFPNCQEVYKRVRSRRGYSGVVQ